MQMQRDPIPGVARLNAVERVVLVALYGASLAPSPYKQGGANDGIIHTRCIAAACEQVGVTVTETYAAIDNMSTGGWFILRDRTGGGDTVRLLPDGAALAAVLMTGVE